MGEYIAKQGDTWDLISFKCYGSEYYMAELILENYQYIDTVVFEGGEAVKIPVISMEDTSNLAPWRQ